MSRYQPCRVGLHVCGINPLRDEPITIANFPLRDAAEARRLFSVAKSECAAQSDEEGDFVVDLNVGTNELQVEDFIMSRQMLARLSGLLNPGRRKSPH